MTFPFLSLFKKAKAQAQALAQGNMQAQRPAGSVPASAPAPVEKSSAERLSKTVMPNSTRTVPSAGSFSPWMNSVTAAPPSSAATGPRSISFGSSASQAPGLPPAVALALEPRVERAVSLELSDVIAQMPEGFVRPLEPGEANRPILLKAAELERGMANGRPTVSMATIYQQMPSLFVREVGPSDPTQLPLPLDKVLEQFEKLQVRADQFREQVVPFVETPFLRVTLEDDTKFGTSIGPIETAPIPTVRLEPATAESIAAAHPEATQARSSTAPPPTSRAAKVRPESDRSKPLNGESNGSGQASGPLAPARIPFNLSPKGADVPATERVPASGGPSVPTSEPARIPFQISPSNDDLGAPAEPWLTKDNLETEVTGDGPAIALPLKAIMEMLPPFQLIGDVSTIPVEARLDLPFALIEPQLASGRVQLTPAQFAAALPEEYRAMFDVQGSTALVSLPLHDVLSNLPTASLRMRDDQIEQEKGADFDTPFSAKAKEDARRFKVAGAPVPKPVVAPPAEADAASAADEEVVGVSEENESSASGSCSPSPEADASIPAETADASPPTGTRTALQAALDTDDELDAKTVVVHINKMSGLKACAIMFADGLSLAGKLPDEYQAEGLCAMAPSLLQRIENHMVETKLGGLRAMTLSCTSAAITFLMQGNLCLAALHTTNDLTAELRERLACVVHELSRKYSNPV